MEDSQSIGHVVAPAREHHCPDACRNWRETLFDHFTVRTSLPLDSMQEWRLTLPQRVWYWFKTRILKPITERIITLFSPKNAIEKIIDNEVSNLRKEINTLLHPFSPSPFNQRYYRDKTLRELIDTISFLYEYFDNHITIHCETVLQRHERLSDADKMRLINHLKYTLLSGDIVQQLQENLNTNAAFISLVKTHPRHLILSTKHGHEQARKMMIPHQIFHTLREKLARCAAKLDVSYQQLIQNWRPVSGGLTHLLEEGHLSPEAFCRLQQTYRQGIVDTTEAISQRPYVEKIPANDGGGGITASFKFIQDMIIGSMLDDVEDEALSGSNAHGHHEEAEKKIEYMHYLARLTQYDVVAWHTLSCHLHRAHQKNLETALRQALNNVLGCKVILPLPARRYKVFRSQNNANHIVIQHMFKYHQLAEALPPTAAERLPSASSEPPSEAQVPPRMTAVDNFAAAKNLSTYKDSWSNAKITASMQFIIDLDQPDRAMVSPFDLNLTLP